MFCNLQVLTLQQVLEFFTLYYRVILCESIDKAEELSKSANNWIYLNICTQLSPICGKIIQLYNHDVWPELYVSLQTKQVNM